MDGKITPLANQPELTVMEAADLWVTQLPDTENYLRRISNNLTVGHILEHILQWEEDRLHMTMCIFSPLVIHILFDRRFFQQKILEPSFSQPWHKITQPSRNPVMQTRLLATANLINDVQSTSVLHRCLEHEAKNVTSNLKVTNKSELS